MNSDAKCRNYDTQSTTRPLSLQWISEDRIQETIRVFSKAYRRPVSEGDAIEILTNVRRLAEILLRAEEEKRAAQRSPIPG